MSKLLIVTDDQFDYLKRLIDSEAEGKAQPVDAGYDGPMYRHLDGDVNHAHDLQDAFAKVPRPGDVIPNTDDLIDAADELHAGFSMIPDEPIGPTLLEQVAILLLPDGGVRDELLEGRTDLNQPEVR